MKTILLNPSRRCYDKLVETNVLDIAITIADIGFYVAYEPCRIPIANNRRKKGYAFIVLREN